MYKNSIRQQAIRLREEGYSYTDISLKIGIPKSTLSDWLSAIPYTPNEKTIKRIGKAIAAANAKKVRQKQESIANINEDAAQEIGALSRRDLFMFGLGLYAGDGSKTAGVTRIVNSDPNVICLAIAWFRNLGITQEQFSLTLHVYPDSDIPACLQFWSRTTTIPTSQFGKIQIDRRVKKRARPGKLPYGTAHLSVRGLGKKEFGIAFARRIQGWTNAVVHKTMQRTWSNGMTRPFQG